MPFSRLFLVLAFCVPFALLGCNQQTAQDNTAPVTATPVAPVMTQAPVPTATLPVDTRTPATAADRAWMTQTAPLAEEAARILRKYLDAPSNSKEDALANLREFRASMEQCKSKLVVAPRSPNFTKAHRLLFDGANQCVTGASLILLGQGFSESDAGQRSMNEGKEKMLAGGDSLEAGIKAAKESVSQLRE